MTIGQQMTRYRAKNNLTQKDLAKAMGVSVQTICMVETEQQTPSRITQQKFLMLMEGGSNED